MSRDPCPGSPETGHYRGRLGPLSRIFANSWRRDLRARNLARKTIKTYGESADQLVAHLAAEGVTTAAEISQEHVSDFMTELLATRSASTASVRFRALQQFFARLVDEEEIATSPMTKLRPPKIPEQLTPT